jgi:hypothetical protein
MAEVWGEAGSSIELYLETPGGEKIAELIIPEKASGVEVLEVSVPVTAVKGLHDLVMVLRGQPKISAWKFESF